MAVQLRMIRSAVCEWPRRHHRRLGHPVPAHAPQPRAPPAPRLAGLRSLPALDSALLFARSRSATLIRYGFSGHPTESGLARRSRARGSGPRFRGCPLAASLASPGSAAANGPASLALRSQWSAAPAALRAAAR